MAAKTNDQNEPLPAATSATGAMMNTDAAGVTPEMVTRTLPSTLMERDSSCL